MAKWLKYYCFCCFLLVVLQLLSCSCCQRVFFPLFMWYIYVFLLIIYKFVNQYFQNSIITIYLTVCKLFLYLCACLYFYVWLYACLAVFRLIFSFLLSAYLPVIVICLWFRFYVRLYLSVLTCNDAFNLIHLCTSYRLNIITQRQRITNRKYCLWTNHQRTESWGSTFCGGLLVHCDETPKIINL